MISVVARKSSVIHISPLRWNILLLSVMLCGAVSADPIFGGIVPAGPWGSGLKSVMGNASAGALLGLGNSQQFVIPDDRAALTSRKIQAKLNPSDSSRFGQADGTITLDASVDRGVFDIVAKAHADFTGKAVAQLSTSGQFLWWDTVTLAGPPGRELKYEFALDNNASISAQSGAPGFAGLYEQLDVAKTSGFLNGMFSPTLSLCNALNSGKSDPNQEATVPSCSNPQTGLIEGENGDSFEVLAGLQFDVGAATSRSASTSDFSVIDRPSFHIILTPLSDGATFNDASGASYALLTLPRVPEPGSILLLGTALVGIVSMIRRRPRGQAARGAKLD